MKKLFFASLAFAALLSCNRDDDSNSTSNSVVGKWKITKFLVLNGKDKSVLDNSTNSGCEASNTFEFKSDKNYYFTYYDTSTGTCKIGDTDTGTYTYNTSTKVLTTVSPSGTENVEIYSLTNSEMQIISDTDDYNNDGTLDLEIAVFAKQ